MTIYLGPVGSLQAIPYMGRGIGAPLDLGASVQRTLSGARTVDYVGTPKRTYSMERKYLTADENSVLESLALGGFGPGPHVLLDPWRRNLLSSNQSTGTDVLADTTGFRFIAGALSSSTAQAFSGLRSLAMAATAALQGFITGTNASITAADTTVDIPVLSSTAYTAQVVGRISTSTGTLRLDIRWYDSAGAYISGASSTTTAMSTSAWSSPVTVTSTSPSTAALARLFVTNPAMGAAQTIYLDQFQFEQASAASAWVLGTGVPRVAFTSIGASYPFSPLIDATIELQEVG